MGFPIYKYIKYVNKNNSMFFSNLIESKIGLKNLVQKLNLKNGIFALTGRVGD